MTVSSRRTFRAAGAVLLTGLMMGVNILPAQADPGYLKLSADGRTFARHLAGPVFTSGAGVVPGGTQRGSLWVRNDSPDPATLSLGAVVRGAEAGFSVNLGMTVGSEAGNSARTALAAAGGCAELARGWNLGAGQSLRLDLILDLAAAAPNATRGQTTNLDVVFLLQQLVPAVDAGSACSADGSEVRVAGLATGASPRSSRSLGHAVEIVAAEPGTVVEAPYVPMGAMLQATVVANRKAWGFAALAVLALGVFMMENRRRRWKQ